MHTGSPRTDGHAVCLQPVAIAVQAPLKKKTLVGNLQNNTAYPCGSIIVISTVSGAFFMEGNSRNSKMIFSSKYLQTSRQAYLCRFGLVFEEFALKYFAYVR